MVQLRLVPCVLECNQLGAVHIHFRGGASRRQRSSQQQQAEGNCVFHLWFRKNFTRYTISSEFTSRRALRNDRADCGTIPAINYGDPAKPTSGRRCQHELLCLAKFLGETMANDARAKRREFLKMAATGAASAASVGVLSHSS